MKKEKKHGQKTERGDAVTMTVVKRGASSCPAFYSNPSSSFSEIRAAGATHDSALSRINKKSVFLSLVKKVQFLLIVWRRPFAFAFVILRLCPLVNPARHFHLGGGGRICLELAQKQESRPTPLLAAQKAFPIPWEIRRS